MPESPHRNHQCKLIVNKIRKGGAVMTTGDTLSRLALATHSLMLSMNKNEETRIKERAEDKSEKLLIRNLGPKQQGLFTKIRASSSGLRVSCPIETLGGVDGAGIGITTAASSPSCGSSSLGDTTCLK
jgi:hypothetical protein